MTAARGVKCLSLLAAACSASDGLPAAAQAREASPFSRLYAQVLVPELCTDASCHGGPEPGGALRLDAPEAAHEELVDVPASGFPCANRGLVRVVPGSPERSLLYLKLTDNPCGTAMPPARALDAPGLDAVYAWIADGAQR